MGEEGGSHKRRRRRKFAAVLAGGLVVGVGTAATLASWNDAEFAQGDFKAGHFAIEGSVDGGSTYSEHGTVADAATLSFETPIENLAPGDWINSEFKLRLDAASTNDGTVKVKATEFSGDFTGVAFYAWQEPSGSCAGKAYDPGRAVAFSYDAGARGYKSYGDWTMYNPDYDPEDPTSEQIVHLKKSATAGQPGDPMTICIAISGGSTLKQAASGTAVWKITATSVND